MKLLIGFLALLGFFRALAAFTTPPACPRFVSCQTGTGGLGDQLEQAVYCIYIATLLDADVILDGFLQSSHRGGSEYRDAAALLGINLRLTVDGARSYFVNPPLSSPPTWITAPEAEALNSDVRSGKKALPCHTLYASDIRTCSGVDAWCDVRPFFNNFDATFFRLRRNDAKQACLDRGLGFTSRGESNAVHISWHIRTGDICLHCGDVSFFQRIYSQLLSVSVIARSHVIAFESSHRVEWLDNQSMFSRALFYHTNQTLFETLCRFITADILITSGSSFAPFVAAFLPPLSPIVLEERRKEAGPNEIRFIHHFFQEHEAILMEDGKIADDGPDFITLLDSVTRDRFQGESWYGTCTG